jgi:hypothetical protein
LRLCYAAERYNEDLDLSAEKAGYLIKKTSSDEMVTRLKLLTQLRKGRQS